MDGFPPSAPRFGRFAGSIGCRCCIISAPSQGRLRLLLLGTRFSAHHTDTFQSKLVKRVSINSPTTGIIKCFFRFPRPFLPLSLSSPPLSNKASSKQSDKGGEKRERRNAAQRNHEIISYHTKGSNNDKHIKSERQRYFEAPWAGPSRTVPHHMKPYPTQQGNLTLAPFLVQRLQ